MSCDHCQCEHDEKKLNEAQKELLDRIEFAVGYAININFTNFYKREIMKDIIDAYVEYWYDKDSKEKYEEAKQQWKKNLLDDIEKIAITPDGLSATKEYINIITNLL